MHMLKSQHLVPENTIVFGDRIFKKVMMVSFHMFGVLMSRRYLNTDMYREKTM